MSSRINQIGLVVVAIFALVGCQSAPRWAFWKHDTSPENASLVAKSTAPALPSTQSVPQSLAAASRAACRYELDRGCDSAIGEFDGGGPRNDSRIDLDSTNFAGHDCRRHRGAAGGRSSNTDSVSLVFRDAVWGNRGYQARGDDSAGRCGGDSDDRITNCHQRPV